MSETSTSAGLARLLGNGERAAFLRDHWESAPLLVRGGLHGGAAELLTLDTFARLSFSGSMGSVSVVSNGTARPVDLRQADGSLLSGAYADGRTLLASRVEQGWAPVADLCRALDLEFLALGIPLAAAVSGNAYLTPVGSRGFDLHYDNHCAFVIQLHGHKDWQVFDPVEELPLERCEQAIPREELGPPRIATSLTPGDVLYIPRGFPHRASAGSESSLHLTLSLRTVTWAEAISDLCRASAPFRRSIPPIAPSPAAATAYLQQTLKPELAQLDLGDYRELRVARGLARLAPLPTNRFQAIDATAAIGEDTLVQRVHQMTCLSSREGDSAVLRLPGATLRLHPVMAPVFEFLAEVESFRPCELPSVDATYDPVELTRLLVIKGLLAPRRTGSSVNGGDGRSTTVSARPPGHPEAQPAADQEVVAADAVPDTRDLTLLRSGEPGAPAAPHLDWLCALRRLTDDECDAVIAACRKFPETAPTTVAQDRYPGRRQVISREVGLNAETREVLELIRDLAAEAATSHYRLALTGITRPPQYLEYQPGNGHFDRHNDYSHDPADSPRKLTVILQLSTPEDYDGGRLHVYGLEPEELPYERGSILLFPSFLYHSVSPVVRGVRRALVCWVGGPRLR
jgi:hypothetical protein